jgi:uncharacterized repeat protein (TIGR03943 family)
VSRESENTLLLLIGLATGMITVSGVFTRYVKGSLQVWLLITAAVVIALAVVAIITDIRRASARVGDGDRDGSDPGEHEADGGHGDHDDEHAHHGSVAWLLLLPVVVLIFITPPALRPDASVPTITNVSTDVLRRDFPPLPDGRAPEVSPTEIMVRAAQDTSGSLTDRLITVTGFTMPEAGEVDLGRFSVLCCAADARLARVRLAGSGAAEAAALPQYTWIRVEGTVVPGPGGGDSTSVPTLDVSAITPIDPPDNVYG